MKFFRKILFLGFLIQALNSYEQNFGLDNQLNNEIIFLIKSSLLDKLSLSLKQKGIEKKSYIFTYKFYLK
jgi:hypothetical protein